MHGLVLYIPCWFMIWRLGINLGFAQELPYLKVKPADLQGILQLEAKARFTHNSVLLAEAWYRYGEEYEQVGDNERAEPYFLNALKIVEPRGDSQNLLHLYFRLSEIEQRQQHLSEALNYGQKALRMAKRTHSASGLIEAYRRLGHIQYFIWNGDRSSLDSVYFYYTKSSQLATQIHDTLGMAEANVYLGTLVIINDPGGAISYLKKALPLFATLHHNEWQIKTLIHLSDAYRRTDRLPLAWQSLQQAEHIYTSHQTNEHGIRSMLEDRLSRYYRASGQWKKALNHFERLNELEKQQLLADRNGALTRLNIEYDTEKKELLLKAQKKEIALNAENLKNQQRFTIALLLLLFTAAGMSLVFFRLNRKNQRISRYNEELVKEQNHRVKNNLQIVSSLLRLQAERLTDENAKRAVEESQLRIQTMAILHRRLYDGEQLARVTMNDFVRDLVNGVLQTFDYTHISVSFDIGPIHLLADRAIPVGLILNELTTNACKYAFPNNECPKFSINCHQKERTIHLSVADNGPGLDELNVPIIQTDDLLVEQHKSFGTALIQAQVAQLNGTGHFKSNKEMSSGGVLFMMEFNG